MKYMRPVFVETSGKYNHKLFFMHLQSNAEFFGVIVRPLQKLNLKSRKCIKRFNCE